MASKNTAGRTRRFLLFLILFGPALILIFISTRGCTHKFKILEDYGAVAPYSFIDGEGKKHSTSDLKGNIVLINTLQPSCPDSCAISFWHLDQLIYQHVRKNKKKLGSVRIISFVTDGEGKPLDDLSSVRDMIYDQVEEYDPEVWMLASGDPKAIYDMTSNGQNLLEEGDEYFGGNAYQELQLLVDTKNHLRMVLPGDSEGMVRRMKEHVALLIKQYDKEKANAKKK
jgi:cytochrome oxidase Cu insertion factor (SCO1/SenC/PrrC family)